MLEAVSNNKNENGTNYTENKNAAPTRKTSMIIITNKPKCYFNNIYYIFL